MKMILNSKPHQVHDLLELVCREIQLTDTQYKNSQTSYAAAGEWLTAGSGTLARYNPDVFPQGSRLLGTSVRPRDREEFDVDAVCQLTYPTARPDPMRVYDDVHARLHERATYRPMLEQRDRCLRLNYAEGTKFHLDVVPAVPAPMPGELYGELAILIPDCSRRGWSVTNPLGFAKWYAGRAVQGLASWGQAMAASVAPLPAPEESGEKAVLQRMSQLFKRRRDVHFGEDDKAPKSILLTTLNGYGYEGEQLIGDAIINNLDRIAAQHDVRWPSVQRVDNPTYRQENLARHWLEDKKHFDNFLEYVAVFRGGMRRLVDEDGLERQARILNELFDPTGSGIVNRAVKTYTERVQSARMDGLLGIHSTTLRTPAPVVPAGSAAAVSAIPRNSFYGD